MARTHKPCVPTNWVLMPSIHRLRKLVRPSKHQRGGKIRGLGSLGMRSLQALPNVAAIPAWSPDAPGDHDQLSQWTDRTEQSDRTDRTEQSERTNQTDRGLLQSRNGPATRERIDRRNQRRIFKIATTCGRKAQLILPRIAPLGRPG